MARLLRRTALAASSARHRRAGDDKPAVGAIAHRAGPIDRAPRREDFALASLDPAEEEKQAITA